MSQGFTAPLAVPQEITGLAEFLPEKEGQRLRKTGGHGAALELREGQPADLALVGGAKLPGEALRPEEEDQIAVAAVLRRPLLHAAEAGGLDGEARLLTDLPDDGADQGFPGSTWPPGKV